MLFFGPRAPDREKAGHILGFCGLVARGVSTLHDGTAGGSSSLAAQRALLVRMTDAVHPSPLLRIPLPSSAAPPLPDSCRDIVRDLMISSSTGFYQMF